MNGPGGTAAAPRGWEELGMATEREVKATVQRAFEAFGKWDEPVLTQVFGDAIWHVPERSPLAGDHRRRDEYDAYRLKIGELSDKTADYQPHDIMASAEHRVAPARVLAERLGCKLDVSVAYVCHVKDGRIPE